MFGTGRSGVSSVDMQREQHMSGSFEGSDILAKVPWDEQTKFMGANEPLYLRRHGPGPSSHLHQRVSNHLLNFGQ